MSAWVSTVAASAPSTQTSTSPPVSRSVVTQPMARPLKAYVALAPGSVANLTEPPLYSAAVPVVHAPVVADRARRLLDEARVPRVRGRPGADVAGLVAGPNAELVVVAGRHGPVQRRRRRRARDGLVRGPVVGTLDVVAPDPGPGVRPGPGEPHEQPLRGRAALERDARPQAGLRRRRLRLACCRS